MQRKTEGVSRIWRQEIVECSYCKKEFTKDSSEVKRNKQLGRKIILNYTFIVKGI